MDAHLPSSKYRTLVGGLILALGAGVVGIGPAHAQKREATIVFGTCTAGSSTKIKMKPEDGGLVEVDFDVDALPNQSWHVVLTVGGVERINATYATDQFGSIDLEVVAPAGTNRASGRAVNAATGETCTASI